MCGKTSVTKQDQQTQPPWQVMQQYNNVTSAANAAAALPYQAYTGQMVAPVNPFQYTGLGGLSYYANDAQPVINQAENVYGAAAQPLTQDQIMNYYSPYQQAVIQATQNRFQQENAIQNQQVKGNAIAQGALGGDREGIAEAVLAENQQIAQAPVIAGLENTGYNQAVALAMQQYQQNPMAAAYGAVNTALAGQGAGLQGAQAEIAGGTLEQTTQQAQDVAAQTAYWQQQGYPFQVASWLAQTTLGYAGTQGSTTQGTTTQPAPFFGMSDERAKEDISRVGSTKDGQPLYRYRFKGDPEWHVGLIAQEVEKKHPEAVADLGSGYKGVDVKAATDSSVGKGYQFGGSPIDAGGLGPAGLGGTYGPFDPGLTGSPFGLGRALAPNPAMQGQTLKAPPLPKPDKPQSGMDMFNQAKGMAQGAQDLYGGAQKAGNWFSSNAASAAGAQLSPEAATHDIMAAAEGTDVPLGLDAATIGEGATAAAPEALAAAAPEVAGGALADLGPLAILALAQRGGRINYPGGLALPARNRINLPMRAGLGMPSFVRSRGYQEGGTPTLYDNMPAGDEGYAEALRQRKLASDELFSPTSMGTSATDSSFVPVDEQVANPATGTLGTPQVLPPEITRGVSAPGVGGVSPQVMAYGSPPPAGVSTPPPSSGGYQRTMLPPSERPQLLSGQGLDIGGLHISPEVGMAILSGIGGLLASPAIHPGTAIGQALLTGLQTYGGIKGKEVDIEQAARALDQRAQVEQDRIDQEGRRYNELSEFQKQTLAQGKERLEQENWATVIDPMSGKVRLYNKKTGEIKDVPTKLPGAPGVPGVSAPSPVTPPATPTTTAGGPEQPTATEAKPIQIASQETNGITAGSWASDVKPASIATPTHPELQHRNESALEDVDEKTANLVRQVADYKIDPSRLGFRDRTNAFRLIASYDPDWSQVRYNTIAKAMPNFTGSGVEARNMTSQDMAMQHIGSALDNIRLLDQGNVVGWNAVRNAIKGQYDPKTQHALGAIGTDVQAIQNELTTSFRGSGHPSEREALQWASKIDYNNPTGLRSALQEAASLLGGRIQAAGSRYNDAVGDTYARDPSSWMSKKGLAAYNRAAMLDPEKGEGAALDRYNSPDDVRAAVKAGKLRSGDRFSLPDGRIGTVP